MTSIAVGTQRKEILMGRLVKIKLSILNKVEVEISKNNLIEKSGMPDNVKIDRQKIVRDPDMDLLYFVHRNCMSGKELSSLNNATAS